AVGRALGDLHLDAIDRVRPDRRFSWDVLPPGPGVAVEVAVGVVLLDEGCNVVRPAEERPVVRPAPRPLDVPAGRGFRDEPVSAVVRAVRVAGLVQRGRKSTDAVVVVVQRQAPLLHVALTLHAGGSLAYFLDGGEEEADEDGDDRYHH